MFVHKHSETCLKPPLKKKAKIRFQDNYRLMKVKNIAESAILLTFIKLPFAIKTFLFIFEWLLKTGFHVKK